MGWQRADGLVPGAQAVAAFHPRGQELAGQAEAVMAQRVLEVSLARV